MVSVQFSILDYEKNVNSFFIYFFFSLSGFGQ